MKHLTRKEITRKASLLPGGVPKWVRCYDNGGTESGGSIDRYTAVFTGHWRKRGGNSILPSSCPEILRPLAFGGGILRVVPDEIRDTHDLVFTFDSASVVLTSHPNGYSCHSLATRIIAGNAGQIANQAAYIEQCGGASNWEAIFKLPGLSEPDLRAAHENSRREFKERAARLNESFCQAAKLRGANAGLADASRYDKCPPDFEPSENPYGMNTEQELYQAWAGGYEDAFEANKGKP